MTSTAVLFYYTVIYNERGEDKYAEIADVWATEPSPADGWVMCHVCLQISSLGTCFFPKVVIIGR